MNGDFWCETWARQTARFVDDGTKRDAHVAGWTERSTQPVDATVDQLAGGIGVQTKDAADLVSTAPFQVVAHQRHSLSFG